VSDSFERHLASPGQAALALHDAVRDANILVDEERHHALTAQLYELLTSLDPALLERLEYLQLLESQESFLRDKGFQAELERRLSLEKPARGYSDRSRLERRDQEVIARGFAQALKGFQEAQQKMQQIIAEYRAEFARAANKAASLPGG